MRVAAYYRYSTDNKGQRDNSELRQREAVEKIIFGNGWNLVGSYVDEAVSGVDDKPQLNSLKNHVLSGKIRIDAICIDSLSRISRKGLTRLGEDIHWITDAKILLSIADKNNGLPISVDKIDDDLSLIVDGWQNNQYIKSLSRSVTNGLRSKFTNNKLGWVGRPPYGYDLLRSVHEPSRLVANSDLYVVEKLLRHFLNGGSIRSCCGILEEASKFRTSPTLHASMASIKNILRNSIYAGIRTFGVRGVGKFNTIAGRKESWVRQNPLVQACYYSDYVSDGFRACISIDEYKRIQEMLDNNQKKKKRFPERQRFLWSGFARCAHCGCAMSAHTHRSSSKGVLVGYVCVASGNGSRQCKDGDRPFRKKVDTDRLTDLVSNALLETFASPDFHIRTLKSLVDIARKPRIDGVDGIDSDIKIQEERLSELTKLFISIGGESLKKTIQEQSDRIEELKSKRGDIKSQEINILDIAKDQYSRLNKGIDFFPYLGNLYLIAVSISTIENDREREEKICKAAPLNWLCMNVHPFHADGLDVSKIVFNTGFDGVRKLFGSSFSPNDLLKVVQGIGISHFNVVFGLGAYRGKVRREAKSVEFCQSVTLGSGIDMGVVVWSHHPRVIPHDARRRRP